MDGVKDFFPFYSESEDWPGSYTEYFHFMDIDGDGDRDFIYDGWSGGEPMMVSIYLYQNGHFELLLNQFTHIADIRFEGGKLSKLIIDNPGCCMPVMEYRYTYKFVSENDGQFTAYLTENKGWHVDTQKPVEWFAAPIRFEVLNTPYSLRITPEIINEGHHFLDLTGNLLETFRMGDTGTALAAETDSTGRIWWYVVMDPPEDILPKTDEPDDFPLKYEGWMSSRFLKTIE